MIELYDHQKNAIEKMHNGSILVGGVGTGKSRTALAYYFKACGYKLSDIDGSKLKLKELLIITTARKRDTFDWDLEMAPFLLSRDENVYGVKVTVDSWNNVQKYVDLENAFVIFDEQRVVGTGAWVKAFIKISKKNEWILLSATPGDTWSDYAPVFVANGFYKNLTDFTRQHVVFSRFARYPKVDHYVEVQKLIRQRNQILVYMHFKKATIPHHSVVTVAYDKNAYAKVASDRWDVYKEEPCQDAGAVCRVLRQIVNTDVTRIWALEEIIDKHKKVIVFYNYNYELDILREMATSMGIRFAEWNGQKHEPMPVDDQWLYLVQYTAGAEGWNCIETNCIVFYSQNYSYKIMTQSAGRIDRLNTPYTDLYFYHLRSSSSIDNAIHRCLSGKRDFNEKAFVEGKKV